MSAATHQERAAVGGAVNYIQTATGRVRAVCQCCGHTSSPVVPDDSGEPDLWKMARGWSTAPFPADCKHDDGSVGSTFTCPACNKRLRTGETLTVRAYMGGVGRTRYAAGQQLQEGGAA